MTTVAEEMERQEASNARMHAEYERHAREVIALAKANRLRRLELNGVVVETTEATFAADAPKVEPLTAEERRKAEERRRELRKYGSSRG